MTRDERFMREALKEAQRALVDGEIPVGCVIVCKGRIIARAYNQTERLNDATAHAEMLAVTAASNYLGSKYLDECELYVTLEPCIMCAGALSWVQLHRLIFGASDEQRGYQLTGGDTVLHPKTEVVSNVLPDKSKELINSFFKRIRE